MPERTLILTVRRREAAEKIADPAVLKFSKNSYTRRYVKRKLYIGVQFALARGRQRAVGLFAFKVGKSLAYRPLSTSGLLPLLRRGSHLG